MPDGEDLLGTDTNATLQRVLQQAVGEVAPDAIIATGDLAHGGGVRVYQQFLSTIVACSDAPLLCLPGNHDVGQHMIDAGLPMEPLALGSWSVVGLDSHEDDKPKAHVDEPKREGLMNQWGEQEAKYGLLATHHPLLPIGAPWLDKDRLDEPNALMDVLIESSGPVFSGAIFGHAHQVIQGHYRGHPLWGTPSTAFQFLPRSRQFSTDDRPPGYRWLTLDDDGQIHSQVAWLH